MTLTLTISADVESRLRDEAAKAGLDPADYARRLIEQHLPQGNGARDTVNLLDQWEAEDFTDDPEELASRRREAEEFMRAMNRNRVDSEGPHARRPYPQLP